MKTVVGRAIAALGVLWLVSCASAPETREERATVIEHADNALAKMMRKDSSLDTVLASAAGWVVFPEIGEGGFIVGAQQGVGVVYERGRGPVGFAVLRQGSVGAQVGGRKFAELIILRTPEALSRLRGGNFELTAQAQATALTMGAAEGMSAEGDTSVLINDESGLMASAAVGGQAIDFEPMA